MFFGRDLGGLEWILHFIFNGSSPKRRFRGQLENLCVLCIISFVCYCEKIGKIKQLAKKMIHSASSQSTTFVVHTPFQLLTNRDTMLTQL